MGFMKFGTYSNILVDLGGGVGPGMCGPSLNWTSEGLDGRALWILSYTNVRIQRIKRAQ